MNQRLFLNQKIMLQIQNLTFSYPKQKPLFQDLNFTVNRGEHLAIIMPSQSGKSTLAHLLAGLLTSQNGNIKIDNSEKISLVFPFERDIITPTVEREIAFSLENFNYNVDEMHTRVDELLSQFGLEKYRKASPDILSFGQREMLSLASALALKPDFLIIDEIPNYNWKRLHKWYPNLSIIQLSMNLKNVLYADRWLILNKGKILWEGTPREVCNKHLEDLAEMGLLFSYTMEVVLEMRAKGIKIRGDIFTPEELRECRF